METLSACIEGVLGLAGLAAYDGACSCASAVNVDLVTRISCRSVASSAFALSLTYAFSDVKEYWSIMVILVSTSAACVLDVGAVTASVEPCARRSNE